LGDYCLLTHIHIFQTYILLPSIGASVSILYALYCHQKYQNSIRWALSLYYLYSTFIFFNIRTPAINRGYVLYTLYTLYALFCDLSSTVAEFNQVVIGLLLLITPYSYFSNVRAPAVNWLYCHMSSTMVEFSKMGIGLLLFITPNSYFSHLRTLAVKCQLGLPVG
jgi:hypothetical protein